MKKVVIASKNPVKVNAVREGFGKMFPSEEFTVIPLEVSSGVNHQPVDEEETVRGASMRVENASKEAPDADFWVGIEGGTEDRDGDMHAFTWAIVRSKEGVVGKGKSTTLILPPALARLVRGGMALGDADDTVFGKTNSKQANGAIGILTGDVITRTMSCRDAVALALVRFKNPKLY